MKQLNLSRQTFTNRLSSEDAKKILEWLNREWHNLAGEDAIDLFVPIPKSLKSSFYLQAVKDLASQSETLYATCDFEDRKRLSNGLRTNVLQRYEATNRSFAVLENAPTRHKNHLVMLHKHL